MTNILLALLILANVGLWMWSTWYKDPVVRVETPVPREDVAGNKMRLVSEPGARLVTRPRSSRAQTQEGTAAESGCYRLGPFPSPDKAQAAAVILARWGLAAERVTEFETLGTAYRLYLPPYPSKEAAETKRRELTQLGFTDHAMIEHEPGMEHALSLGSFAVEHNAQTRREQLAAKGIHAAIQRVPNVHALYWLALPGSAADGRFGDVPLARFAEHDWGGREIALKTTACAAAPRESAGVR